MKTDKKALSIYIHIPFCIRKCLYCDFLSAPADYELQEQYLQALLREIRQEATKYKGRLVRTIFFGGGTPSVIPAKWIAKILQTILDCYQVAKEREITIEVNPGTVDFEKLSVYQEAGVNRLSIGLQSAHNAELQKLGRIHSAEDFFQTYESAIKSGFNNVNVDVMAAIPGQTLASYQSTLHQILALQPPPTHISAYSLIIEEGTPFFEDTPQLPDEETDREMYKITDAILKENGYHRYEISNYAKEGYECIHNKVYWQRGDYAGFGIGAASLVDNVRFTNVSDIGDYIYYVNTGNMDTCKETQEILSLEEQMEEYMFLGLRMRKGVSTEGFEQTFGKKIDAVYPGLVKKLTEQGLLYGYCDEITGEHYIALTEFGLDVSNVVMAEFLLKSEN